MGTWPDNVDAITLFVEDLTRSKQFYETTFGLQAIFEDESSTAFRIGSLIINLLKSLAARDLIEPAPVGSPGDGSRFQLTIGVDDVDSVCGELISRGVRMSNGPMNRPWRMRTASFADPDGHIWEVAQELPNAGA